MLSPRGARGVKKAELSATLIQTTTTEAPRRTYVLHRTGCAQEDHQLLHQGRERSHLPRRESGRDPLGTRHLDQDSSATLDSGDGSYDLHRLDIRSFEATRSGREGRSSAHVAG